MRIALSVWEGRISPVFDTARSLLVVEREGEGELSRGMWELTESFAPRRAARLAELGLDVLICGAISRPLASLVTAHGIELLPFFSGETEEVLSAYVSGGLALPSCPPRFRMPGCRGGRRRFGRGRWGHGKRT